MARLTGLNVTAYSLNGTAYLGDFEDATASIDPTKADGRGAAERYGKECTVLRAGNISTGLMRNGASCRITNLDISAIAIGAVSVKPTFRGGSLRFSNTILEAQGGSDEWFFGQVESTDYSGSLDVMVDSTAGAFDPMALATGAISGTNTTFTYTAGTGSTITVPITLGQVTHTVTKGELQMFTVEFGRGGVPTAVGTALPLFALGLTGSAAMTFNLAAGTRTYGGDALIRSGELTFGRGQIEKQKFELAIQGAPTS